MLLRMAADAAAANIMKGIAGSAFGQGLSGGEGILGGIGSILGFANGGRPPVGVPSIVGEAGTEMFVPDVAGTIVPNHELGGGGSIINNIVIKTDNPSTFRSASGRIAAQLSSAMRG